MPPWDVSITLARTPRGRFSMDALGGARGLLRRVPDARVPARMAALLGVAASALCVRCARPH
jgi:hypothetical protein